MGTFPIRRRGTRAWYEKTEAVLLVKTGMPTSLRQRLAPNALAALAGERLPTPALRALVGGAFRGLHAALCLHRVGATRPTDWQPGLSMPADELGALLELLLVSRPGDADGWLTVAFDDGYRDAAAWLTANAPRFPQVEFLFFVNPEKAERRAGFRWDLVEERLKAGDTPDAARALTDAPCDLDGENRRPELQALAEHPAYALCTPEELRAVVRHNVTLGNHTNLHLSSARSPDALVREDFRRSTADFERLFGPQRQFAFPFGTPRWHIDVRHVRWLRELGSFPIWTTEARPFRREERQPGAALPRFPIDGTKPAHALAGWMAARALDFRVRGTKHDYRD